MTTAQLTSKLNNNSKENANFILFSAGKLVSLLGSSIYTFTIGLYMLKITGSGLSFAATLACGLLPMVLINPFAGLMADRFNKKLLVVGMDIFSGILLVIIYLLSSGYGLNTTLIYVSTFILSVFTAIFDISMEAGKPNIVSDEKLMDINAISKIISSLCSICGPMIGGVVFAFTDMRTIIILNGISFIMSGISEMFINFRFNVKEENQEKKEINMVEDIKEGFKFLLGKKDNVTLSIYFTALNFFISLALTVPIPYIINNILKLGDKAFGLIQGAFPVGLIIGAIIINKIFDKFNYYKLIAFTSILLCVCMIIAAIPVLPFVNTANKTFFTIYYCVAEGLMGVIISFIDVPIAYILQKTIPDYIRGRVMGLLMSIVKTTAPIALILSGALINVLPPYILPILGGTMMFVVVIYISSRNEDFKLRKTQ